MTDHVIFWLSGFGIGLWAGVMAMSPRRDRDPDWRRSFNHENTNRPSGPPPLRFDPGRVQRSSSGNNSSTPKPAIIPKFQFPAPRTIRDEFMP